MTDQFSKELKEANKVVHDVETEWHYKTMNSLGWIPHKRSATGLVRSYIYYHPDSNVKITVTDGVNASYYNGTDGGFGYWSSLEGYAKGKVPIVSGQTKEESK